MGLSWNGGGILLEFDGGGPIKGGGGGGPCNTGGIGPWEGNTPLLEKPGGGASC